MNILKVEKIISSFYPLGSKTYNILIIHGKQVAQKSLKILDNMPSNCIEGVDKKFILEASMLHDIGICKTSAESIGCLGSLPYICHGIEGKKMLDKIGLNKHGDVCERHVGVGFSSKDIIKMKLPLPVRNIIPVSFEEKLICYADKFFSKEHNTGEKDINDILTFLAKYGEKNVHNFLKLHKYFNPQE